MKVIEENEHGVWFEDSYGHECFMGHEEIRSLPDVVDCDIYNDGLLKDKCELSLALG
tara:strand:+ start:244 stop:414 length:171 start_codon:yes stop_codon:yes gene_type:complete